MLGDIKTAPVGGVLQQAHAKKSNIKCPNDKLSGSLKFTLQLSLCESCGKI